DSEQARMEINWRDGVPQGSVLEWDAQGRLRSLETYRDGFLDGESRHWNEDGSLWILESHSLGRQHGPRLRFYPSGCKEYEERFENGRGVGTTQHWSEAGTLVSEKKNEGWSPMNQQLQ